MKEHWLVRLHLAARTEPGAIRLLDGMNSAWSGSNWRFTPVGTLVLFALGVALGVACGLIGRYAVVHL
jgi:hypothetical protein